MELNEIPVHVMHVKYDAEWTTAAVRIDDQKPQEISLSRGQKNMPLSVPRDPFRDLVDTVTMQEAMEMIAKDGGYELSVLDKDATILKNNLIFTVGNLRVLEASDIQALGLFPVVTRYLLRINAGRIHV